MKSWIRFNDDFSVSDFDDSETSVVEVVDRHTGVVRASVVFRGSDHSEMASEYVEYVRRTQLSHYWPT